MSQKKCLDCGAFIHGRVDKKFCDDSCRINYHNQKYKAHMRGFREVESILRRNRRILAQFLHEGIQTPSEEMLEQAGFNFEYFTHRDVNRPNRFFVYDLGVAKDSDEGYSLLKLIKKSGK
jgi:predicted nucleic acid-binding Zn ribbon protein